METIGNKTAILFPMCSNDFHFALHCRSRWYYLVHSVSLRRDCKRCQQENEGKDSVKWDTRAAIAGSGSTGYSAICGPSCVANRSAPRLSVSVPRWT